MVISELQAQLEAIKQEYGDIMCCSHTGYNNAWIPIKPNVVTNDEYFIEQNEIGSCWIKKPFLRFADWHHESWWSC